MDADYRQEMAAVVCVYDSGAFDVVSCHYTYHDAVEQLEFMRDEGYAEDWAGKLVVVCNGTVYAHVNLDKMSEVINEIMKHQ